MRGLAAPDGETSFDLGVLADAGAFHAPIDITDVDRDLLAAQLERMLLIRRVEEVIAEQVQVGVIKCPCHLAIGQEACAVGVAAALARGDRHFGAHRSHGHYLALGGSVLGLFAEVLGRDTGVSRGMGGSMHLQDRDVGLYGTVPIVGATIPMAVGAALAARLDGNGAVAVSYFGDGATEEGVFHESMNLAAVLPAPVLFVCENNLFSSHLHISIRQPATSTARYAEAHRVRWGRVDGNDVVEVARAARDLVAEMRRTQSPAFLELVTYRWRGHVGWRDDEDVGVARKSDLPEWRRRDPIRRLEESLSSAGYLTVDASHEIRERVDRSVTTAWATALDAPFPASESLLDRVYSAPGKATR